MKNEARIKRSTKIAALYLAALLPYVAADAFAQSVESNEDQIPDDLFFVLGNIEYVLLHELAHVLINDLQIPIVGSQESAADYLAASALIRADRFDPSRAKRARDYLFATAEGLAGSWDFNRGAGVDVQFWDSHALTIQRFYQIVCLIYGSDPERYAGLPNRVGLPAQRATQCPEEFARADRAMEWLLENYGRANDAVNAPIDVAFEPAPSRVSQRVVQAMRANDTLDNTIRRFDERFRVPKAFSIVFRRCGRPQALWLEEAREIVVCYELIDSYYALGMSRSSDRLRE